MYWTTDKATGFLLVTMAIIFFWFGGLKFTPEMTEAVQLFLRNNFLTAWLYDIFSAKAVSYLLASSRYQLAQRSWAASPMRMSGGTPRSQAW
jgi:uncharacterized membrane protein YkgB